MLSGFYSRKETGGGSRHGCSYGCRGEGLGWLGLILIPPGKQFSLNLHPTNPVYGPTFTATPKERGLKKVRKYYPNYTGSGSGLWEGVWVVGGGLRWREGRFEVGEGV